MSMIDYITAMSIPVLVNDDLFGKTKEELDVLLSTFSNRFKRLNQHECPISAFKLQSNMDVITNYKLTMME